MKLLKSEQIVRIVLGLLTSVPIIVIGTIAAKWWVLLFVPVIVAVECIRMGSWGKIGKYDVIPVDIFRGLALGIAISCALI